MNFELIERLIQLLEDSSLDELEVEEEGFRVRLGKHGVAAMPAVMASPAAAAAPAAAETPSGLPEGTVTIDAPMVGTFYRAPAPDAPPFVDVGKSVSDDTTVCILEAMKVMNEIKAKMRGTIVEILVENAQPVEFGQPLFVVKPSGV